MDDSERLKLYQGMVEVSRKWVTTLDTKAGFISAMNAALLGFIWSSARLPAATASWPHRFGLFATGLSLISLCLAMTVVVPRTRLGRASASKEPKGTPRVKAVTFYGFVAGQYPADQGERFVEDVLQLSASDLAREALEQHHAICHVAFAKNSSVCFSGWIWIAAMVVTIIGIFCSVAG